MTLLRPALAAFAAISTVACASEPDPDDVDIDVATTDGEAEAMAREIPAGDFADLPLGAKIVGPRGPEVKVRLSNEAGAFADMTSYVACAGGVDPCDPNNVPAGMPFTYVHTVYPGEDNDPTTGSGAGADSSDVESATRFMMTQPAHGFTGDAGFSVAEVISAVGNRARVVVTCVDGGLAWTIDAGDGGNQWEQGEPITFWWQSTEPPAGPAKAYAIKANNVTATGEGPLPAPAEGGSKGCTG